MRFRLPFARGGNGVSFFAVFGVAAFVLAALPCAAPARAQDAPPGTIGRVEGTDISVESGTAAGLGASSAAPGIYVVNGSVVTVHSGQARMTLASGGHLDICGPAKFTVLESGGAITVALGFGSVHAQLPASAALRFFTPTIIATPLGIGDATRNITVSLGLDTSLCVLASSGAIQLEQQFTGEKLIVPQAGEFSLASGKLAPVPGAAESCQCEVAEPTPEPEEEPAAKPLEKALASPQPNPSFAPSLQPLPAATPVEPSVFAHADESHPIARQRQEAPPAVPPASEQAENMVLPVLVFSASSPAPPDMGPDVVLLARRARVEPEWDFDGHVAVPELAAAVQQALGEGGASAPQSHVQQKKKGGFWSGFKRIFSGG